MNNTKQSRIVIQRTLEEELDFYKRIDIFAEKYGGCPLQERIYSGNFSGGYRIWTGTYGIAIYIRGLANDEHDELPLISPTTPITPVPQYISSRLEPGNRILIQNSQKPSIEYVVISAERRNHHRFDVESFLCVMLRDRVM